MVIDREKRNNTIRKLHESGKTQRQIADVVGITFQRVQQIERELGLGKRRRNYKVYTFTCGQCGTEFTSKMANRKYCSQRCFFSVRTKYKTTEEREEYVRRRKDMLRKRSREYYHKVFKSRSDWKQVLRERNMKRKSKQCK